MRTLDRLLAEAAHRTPGAPAVACGADRATYGEVDRLADAYAAALHAQGVRRGDRVVVHSDKSVRTIAALQAVLRLGAAYVPLDGGAPADRARFVAEDCDARAAFADTAERTEAVAGGGARPVVRLDAEPAPAPGARAFDGPASPDALAYILYTSGSTGRPKGVRISHANALAFVDWAVGELAAQPEDVFANHASLGFDLSVLDLYGAFAAGACVVLVPRGLERAPRELVALLVRERISVWYSVPSALMLMMREGGLLDAPPPPRLRAVLFAGEPFPIAHVRRLAAWTDAPLLNLFGPTETNVCTFHRVRPEDLERDVPVPIGVACSGDRVSVLDEHGAPVPDGEEGELVVDGPTVMLGYHGRDPQRGPYRTGDIVRRRPDGTLDYAGRRDHQVKVRGNRVELGEVESAIAAHPDVEEVAVLVAGQAVEARLIAFVAGERPPGTIGVKRACADRLPASMVPDAVQRLERLPRTPNGKVDRAALLDRVRTRPAPATTPTPAGVAA